MLTRLKFEECPKTRKEFIEKCNNSPIFKARAEYTGFRILFNNILMPDGKIATVKVK